jgi:ATP-dependent DNA helicase RecG
MNEEQLIKLLDELTSLPVESEWVEFKMNKGSITDEQIGEYISAMSNGATVHNKPFGFLVWGVEDKTHTVKGTNFRFMQAKHGGNEELELFLRRNLSPKINFEKFEFEYNGAYIVLLRIPAAKSEPTNFQKKPYIRIGSNKTDLRNFPELMRTIYNSQEDWSAKIVDSATIANLDKNAIALAREKFKELNVKFRDEVDEWQDSEFLDRIHITIEGKITNTAILLLGKPETSHYLLPHIAEITWKLEGEEKAYEHFGIPFLLTTTDVMQRIRNIKMKFYQEDSMLAISVDKYDPKSILEAMHNCIAHQDYAQLSRIIVEERVDKLIFTNAGSFFEGTPDDYPLGLKTPKKYRNPFLAAAMVAVGMIDRLGYGIHSLFVSQRNRYFPMPDYSLSSFNEVILQIYGHSIDLQYSNILIKRQDLSLSQVILLDRVQKKRIISDEDANKLKREGLIEGRKPNYFVGKKVSQITEQKAAYTKNKAFEKQYYLDLIIKSISQHGTMKRKEIDELLWKKLPEWMNNQQRKTKIGHLLTELRLKNLIVNIGSFKDANWTFRK